MVSFNYYLVIGKANRDSQAGCLCATRAKQLYANVDALLVQHHELDTAGLATRDQGVDLFRCLESRSEQNPGK